MVLRERWQALQDVHDFHAMLQDLGAGRAQAFRLVGHDDRRLSSRNRQLPNRSCQRAQQPRCRS